MNNSTFKNTAKYSFIQGSYWMGCDSILAFISVFLLYKGCSNSNIGIVIAVGGIIAALLQPFVGDFADKSKKISLQMIIIILSILCIVCAGILAFNISSLIANMLLYVILVALTQMICPLVNAVGMYYINRGVSINFGVARGVGSLAYAVISVIIGKLADIFGAVVIPYSIIAMAVLEIISALVLKYKTDLSNTTDNNISTNDKTGITYFIKKYPTFMIVLLGAACLYFGHGILNNFAFQIVSSLGGGSSEMGILTAIAAVLELPTMIVFAMIIKKISSGNLLKVSGVFFTIKSLGTMLAPNMTVLYIVQLAQMLGFGLYTLASVYYANDMVGDKDKVKGQTYIAMANVMGVTLGSILGGMLMDIGGTKAMTLTATIVSGIGMIIIFVFGGKTNNIDKKEV